MATKPKSRRRLLQKILRQPVFAPKPETGALAAALVGDAERLSQLIQRGQRQADMKNMAVLAREVYRIDTDTNDWQHQLNLALAKELGWFQEPKKQKFPKDRIFEVVRRVRLVKQELNIEQDKKACERMVELKDPVVSDNPQMTKPQLVAELQSRLYEGRKALRSRN